MANGAAVAHIKAKIAKRKAVMRAIYLESAQRLIEVMQTRRGAGGNLRVDTGFLRASLMAQLNGHNFTLRPKPDGEAKHGYDPSQIVLTIARAEITDRIVVAYTANYARPREYGARGQAGDRWVALAAQQWPRIVKEVAREAEARIAR